MSFTVSRQPRQLSSRPLSEAPVGKRGGARGRAAGARQSRFYARTGWLETWSLGVSEAVEDLWPTGGRGSGRRSALCYAAGALFAGLAVVVAVEFARQLFR